MLYIILICIYCSFLLMTYSVQFSHSVVSNSLQPHEPQHTRPPCPSPTPRVHPNPCPLSWWCHPIILFDMRFPTYIKLSVKFQYSRGWYCHCSVAKSCPTLCDPIYCSMPDFCVLHYLPEFAQIHVHWVGDAIQPSHPLWFPSPPALTLSQHQGFFQWVGCSHQVASVLELQL